MKNAAGIREWLFRHRSYTPVPLVVAMLLFAKPTAASFAWGLPMALLGEALRLWGVSLAGSSTRVTGGVGAIELVTSGPFAHVRNPLYLGNILLYVGMGIASNALFPWLQTAGLLWFAFQYSAIVGLEEDYLRTRFGDAYARYCAAVPRFIPSPRRYDGGGPQPELSWARGLRSDRSSLLAIALLSAALVVREMI